MKNENSRSLESNSHEIQKKRAKYMLDSLGTYIDECSGLLTTSDLEFIYCILSSLRFLIKEDLSAHGQTSASEKLRAFYAFTNSLTSPGNNNPEFNLTNDIEKIVAGFKETIATTSPMNEDSQQ